MRVKVAKKRLGHKAMRLMRWMKNESQGCLTYYQNNLERKYQRRVQSDRLGRLTVLWAAPVNGLLHTPSCATSVTPAHCRSQPDGRGQKVNGDFTLYLNSCFQFAVKIIYPHLALHLSSTHETSVCFTHLLVHFVKQPLPGPGDDITLQVVLAPSHTCNLVVGEDSAPSIHLAYLSAQGVRSVSSVPLLIYPFHLLPFPVTPCWSSILQPASPYPLPLPLHSLSQLLPSALPFLYLELVLAHDHVSEVRVWEEGHTLPH
ncbi:hypothetical protein E2C01_004539 [Portunus trituberculatus]|uniref:Uncharacterized protein n=1 Tax=Portunus trituberculatus TaxID=210409 RepID=A0A5B7CT93_PORTR|nr:hypothetical protein [Portunus trituberculatus]